VTGGMFGRGGNSFPAAPDPPGAGAGRRAMMSAVVACIIITWAGATKHGDSVMQTGKGRLHEATGYLHGCTCGCAQAAGWQSDHMCGSNRPCCGVRCPDSAASEYYPGGLCSGQRPSRMVAAQSCSGYGQLGPFDSFFSSSDRRPSWRRPQAATFNVCVCAAAVAFRFVSPQTILVPGRCVCVLLRRVVDWCPAFARETLIDSPES
jgi:hypothetical protein